MTDADRRRDMRLQVGREVLIRNLTADSKTTSAVIENVSQGGCLISTDESLTLDDAIQLSVDDTIYLGQVVHRLHKGGESFTGIRFEHRLSEVRLQRIARCYADPGQVFFHSGTIIFPDGANVLESEERG
jgi:hypothetical protein